MGLFVRCLVATIALLLAIAWSPARAQEGCMVNTSASTMRPGQRYISASRDASTLTRSELEAQLRTVLNYQGPAQPVPGKDGYSVYSLPAQQGLPATDAYIRVVSATHQRFGVSDYIPEGQAIAPRAEALCRLIARVPVPYERAPSVATDRGAAPPVIVRRDVVAPSIPFYIDEAEAALKEGGAILTGPACVIHMGKIRFPEDMPVYLYPATPYLEQLVKLDQSARKSRGRTVLRVADGFGSVRIEGRTNSDGRFQFTRLKPGRYFLTAQYTGSFTGQREVSVASYTNAWGYRSYINEMQDYSREFEDVLERFVDIKSNQDTVNVHLLPRGGLNSVFGCR